jgi:hypothetical protein
MTDDAISPDEVTPAEPAEVDEEARPAVSEPTKLIRIASMTRAILDEIKHAPLDLESRRRVLDIHESSLLELRSILSEELQDEFEEIFKPFAGDEPPSETELRITHAQLIGWLEGLFHGIQASVMTQQIIANQLTEMTSRPQLEPGSPVVHPPEGEQYPGVYL